MSGDRVTFLGDAKAAVVQGIDEAHALIGRPPVVVGGLAVLARLSNPYRATVDLDVVDRRRGPLPQLEVLRAATGAEPVEPSAVLLPTRFGPVKIDVLEVRQVELDRPSDDPGDRLHASAHASRRSPTTWPCTWTCGSSNDDISPGPKCAALQATTSPLTTSTSSTNC